MSILSFDLNLLSKHRTPLMGIAAIMVILVHSVGYGVEMPYILRKVLERGGLGVDIFLLLSGIGCYYSLQKGIALSKWYYNRFIRILIPYALIQIPFWIYWFAVGKLNIIDEIIVFSTITFWTRHIGAWYVALLIPLYILTPPIYRLIVNNKYQLLVTILLILSIITICNISITKYSGVTHEVLRNIQWTFSRTPSFILGLFLAKYVSSCKKVNIIVVTIFPLILYVSMQQILGKDIFMGWLLIWPMLIVCSFILENIFNNSILYKYISYCGIISLESYLANIYLCGLIKDISIKIGDYPIFAGKYLEYSIIVILGFLLSLITHGLAKRINKVL